MQFAYVVVQSCDSENTMTKKNAKKETRKMSKCTKVQELSTTVDTNSSINRQQQGTQ